MSTTARTTFPALALALALAACGGQHAAAVPTETTIPAGPAAPEPTAKVDFSSISADSTRVAGSAMDFSGDWKDLHARLQLEAKRLVLPTEVNPHPTGKLALYVYDGDDAVPDLKAAGATTASEHLLASYDNMGGAWQYCFGGPGPNHDLAKCITDDAADSPALYDPSQP
ncbi:MAG TPA: hypothetical protein VHE35_16975 [Kofleriaceae bacterium]|nr:hypothetical protein [Kofleriaceae bacterium]